MGAGRGAGRGAAGGAPGRAAVRRAAARHAAGAAGGAALHRRPAPARGAALLMLCSCHTLNLKFNFCRFSHYNSHTS